MPFKYKIDVLSALKEKGYNTTVIRKQKIIGEAMLTKIRAGEMPSWTIFDTVCSILELQPSDVIEHVSSCDDSDLD